MPKVEVEGAGPFVEEGRRLILAIEEDAGVHILHRCGGYARCATCCRVEYLEGEPERMTKAELEILKGKGLLGEARPSCQALVEHDVVGVRPLMTMGSTGAVSPSEKPEPGITPEPEWVEKPAP